MISPIGDRRLTPESTAQPLEILPAIVHIIFGSIRFVAKKKTQKHNGYKKEQMSNTSSGIKTRTNSNRASLDSLMAGFQTEGQTKTGLGNPQWGCPSRTCQSLPSACSSPTTRWRTRRSSRSSPPNSQKSTGTSAR